MRQVSWEELIKGKEPKSQFEQEKSRKALSTEDNDLWVPISARRCAVLGVKSDVALALTEP